MGRVGRLGALGALAAVAIVATTASALAQTSTTEPPTTSTTATTIPSGGTTPTTIPAGGTTPTTDPGVNGDAPPESVPNVPVTIPAREPPTGSGSAAVAPNPGRVVRVDLRGARASALARQAALDAAITNRQQLEEALASLQQRVGQLAATAAQAVRDLVAARDELRGRAVDAYIRGPDTELFVVDLTAGPESQRAALLSAVISRDREAVQKVRTLQSKVSRDQAKTAQDLTDTQSKLEQARVDEAQAIIDLGDARLDLAVSSAGGNIVIHGFVFPVASPHSFTEDFGDPRLPDTPQAHFHQGCDVIAAEGTELYAAERGVITQISGGGLGGNGLWLKGESGTAYYYAHLSAYVAGLTAGQLVEAGALVGLVGHTGDAYGPHLHFEVHPGGGSAIDPYPILLAADPQRRSP